MLKRYISSKSHIVGHQRRVRERQLESFRADGQKRHFVNIAGTMWTVTNTIWTGAWKLEWKFMSGERRALFLLRPDTAHPAYVQIRESKEIATELGISY